VAPFIPYSVDDLGRQGRFPTLALASTTERAGAHAAEFQLLLSALEEQLLLTIHHSPFTFTSTPTSSNP
jgi:hypothetical protein